MEWLGKSETRGVQPSPRKGHSMTRLLDSSLVLVFGGETATGQLLNDMYSLHVERLEWRHITYKDGPVPCPRLLHTATAISSTAMVILFGDTYSQDPDRFPSLPSPLKDAWLFDIRDGSWKEIPDQSGLGPFPRSCHTAIFGNGFGQMPAVYVFGGFGSEGSCGPITYRLRIGDWQWERLKICLKNKKGKTVFAEDPSTSTEYDGMIEEDIPCSRESHGAAWLPGLNGMLIVGGDGGFSLQDDCWLLVPSMRHRGHWRWREIRLRKARDLLENELPRCGGFSLVTLPTAKAQVLLWGGIQGLTGGETMKPKISYLIDLDSRQTTRLEAIGEPPFKGRLLHGLVRANNRLIAFGGCDSSGKVIQGLDVAKLLPDFKYFGLHANDFGPVAAGVAAGSSPTELRSEMTTGEGGDELQGGTPEEATIPLVGPSSIPQGTPLSGRILDVSEYGYFVSVVIRGRLYKGVLVANPLKDHNSQAENDLAAKQEPVLNEGDVQATTPKPKRPRLDPAVEALPDSPQRAFEPDNTVVISLD
eukprot:GFKZ01003349.1.p1 GENE.GFKZ01003349.1~~GFKZ01003349.1.p1  ORF type:complete len:603 (+),score=50.89 GFKZ01003349.1:219-1811(+)